MNGAAVNCQQGQALQPQSNVPSSLHSPGYLLQTNYPCQEKNSLHQYSKAMNYKLLPDNFSVDGSSKLSQYVDSYSSETRHRLSNSGDIWNDKINPTRIIREPMELPVPKFEIDENSVGVFTYKKDTSSSVQDSKDLDLDTRIDLLIKSKALSGMHPIFSDLNESEDSSTDSEELYSELAKCKSEKHVIIHHESFDDPEKPLSRPPSPFLSRATYLFWFNKAIELKQQAKAQEQALLEQATKKLIEGSLSSEKMRKTDNSKQEDNLIKNLLGEVSKELKESIKQDFIKEIIEHTVLNSLEDWWVNERKLEENNFSKHKTGTNESAKFQATVDIKLSQGETTTSPNLLFPSTGKINQKPNNLGNHVNSIIELNKTIVQKDVLEGLAKEHGSCRENVCLGTKSVNKNCTIDDPSSREGKTVNSGENTGTSHAVNDTDNTSDKNSASCTSNEMCIEKSKEKLCHSAKFVLNISVNNEEINHHQHIPVIENLQNTGKLGVKSFNENTLVEMEETISSENNIETVKALDTIDNLEENRVSSKDLSVERDKKEERFLQDQVNNKENNSETKQNETQ